MVWAPSARALTVAAGMEAVTLVTAAAGFATVIAVPEPGAPSASMKYSAVAMVEPPLARSSAVAASATLTEPLVLLGVIVIALTVGPVLSTPNVTKALPPQLPAASWPRTNTVCEPEESEVVSIAMLTGAVGEPKVPVRPASGAAATESRRASAASTTELPVETSLIVAVTVTIGPAELTPKPDVIGPSVSPVPGVPDASMMPTIPPNPPAPLFDTSIDAS